MPADFTTLDCEMIMFCVMKRFGTHAEQWLMTKKTQTPLLGRECHRLERVRSLFVLPCFFSFFILCSRFAFSGESTLCCRQPWLFRRPLLLLLLFLSTSDSPEREKERKTLPAASSGMARGLCWKGARHVQCRGPVGGVGN